MKFVQLCSNRRWLDRIIPAGTITTGKLVDKLKDLPRDVPIVFYAQGYYWGIHEDPAVIRKEF